jgi:ATP-dependent protease ClpP protease subunit
MFRKERKEPTSMAKLLDYAGSSDSAHIYIYDEIGKVGYTANDFITEFKKLKPTDKLTIHINSVGGSVIEGLTIYNLIKNHPGPTESIVEGAAASIMSIVALAAKKRRMYDNAVWMIHDPVLSLEGNLTTIQPQLDLLKGAQENIRSIYKSNLKATEEQITEWLKKETYFFAEEALAAGFVHEIITHPQAAASARTILEKLAARFNVILPPPLPTGKNDKDKIMNFDTWLKAECEVLDLVIDKLTEKQRTAFKTKYDALKLEDKKPIDPPKRDKDVDPSAERAAAELERQDGIATAATALAQDDTIKLNADHLKGLGCKATTMRGLQSHAIRSGWSVEKFELEARRATIVDIGHVGIHSQNSVSGRFADMKATACALVKASGMVARKKHPWSGEEYGYEVAYDQKTLEESDKIKDISLLQIFDRVHQLAFGHRYDGRLNTDGFLAKAREALIKLRATGNTTWTSLNIFDDAANKTLWAAYNNVETTWQEFVTVVSVPDFKTNNMYRMIFTGGYQKVGADGQLKHGGFSDQKYTVAAETYGKMVGLSRVDLINDDLGAFNGVMTSLGIEGAKFLEELFWVQLMGQLTTLFPTSDANLNYIAGATTILGVDGLTLLSTKFSDQVIDNAPIGQSPSILLVGTNNRVLAQELYTKTNLDVLQTANVKGRPNGNPHVGLFRPVVSGYINNTNIKQRIVQPAGTAIPGQTQTGFFLLGPPNSPQGGIITGAFLNGRRRPFIEQGDPDFNVLGMQWRAYHDVGAGNGDPRLAAFSKGAA